MNHQMIELELNKLAALPEIISCALVEIDTGMICITTSHEKQFEIMAEGARDYWVLHHRNGHIFDAIGRVQNIFVQHAKGTLCVQSCGKTMLLITLAEQSKKHWHDWNDTIATLRGVVKQYEMLR